MLGGLCYITFLLKLCQQTSLLLPVHAQPGLAHKQKQLRCLKKHSHVEAEAKRPWLLHSGTKALEKMMQFPLPPSRMGLVDKRVKSRQEEGIGGEGMECRATDF